MNESIDYIEVTVKVPKNIVDFLKLVNEDIKEFIENELPSWVGAFINTDEFTDELLKAAIQKTNLKSVVEESYIKPWL